MCGNCLASDNLEIKDENLIYVYNGHSGERQLDVAKLVFPDAQEP